MTGSQSPLTILIKQHELDGKPIQGIALNSFLLMVAKESKTHTINVQAGQKQGILHLKDGTLIDAEYDIHTGLEAAYKILTWKDVAITMGETEKRPQQIANMLSRTLIKEPEQEAVIAAPAPEQDTPQDEPEPAPTPEQKPQVQPKPTEPTPEKEPEPIVSLGNLNLTYTIPATKTDPIYQRPLRALATIRDIRTVFLLNMSGKVAVHSATNVGLGELIIYTIVTCSKLKKSVDAKSLQRIQLQMTDNTTLLILPVSGVIIGMILNPDTVADEIVSTIQSELNKG
jgi:hypothetical protein